MGQTVERIRDFMRKPAPPPAARAVIAVAILLLVSAFLFRDLTPEDSRHELYAAGLWPGREFEREPAIVFRDKGRGQPLTWHVCTATACGHYFEVAGEKAGPEVRK